MAYSANAYGAFSGRPDHRLNLFVYVAGQDQALNGSVIRWGLYAERTGPWQGSYNNGAAPWSVNVGGNITNGSSPLPFSASTWQLQLGTGEHWFNHDAAGNLTIQFSALMSNAGQFGTAQTNTASLSPDRIPGGPGVPGTPVISDILPTSAVMSWGPAAPGHAPVDTYSWAVALDPGLTMKVHEAQVPGSVLSVPLDPLTPGTNYWGGVTAHNVDGWGPTSAIVPFTTLSGVRVSDGTTWDTGEVWVSDGVAWRPGVVKVSDGSSWKNPVA